MNEDNWYQDSDDADIQSGGGYVEPKQGMSTGMKVFIGIAAAGGVMLLLCCGGLVFVGFQFADTATEDPAEILAIQEEIVGIDIPEELAPQGGMDFGLFGMAMKMAVFDDGDAVLKLMQMTSPEGVSDADMQQGFQQWIDQQGRNADFDVESLEERTITIGDEELTFDFQKGKDRAGNEVRLVEGTFQGRAGTGFLIYQCPEEDWDEDRVVQMLESIQN